jgi:anti-sigma factor RsiW
MSDTIRPGDAPYDGASLTHEQAIDGQLAEAYVDGRLPEPAAAAFEEHYFACAECWAEVRTLERLRAAVRDAAAAGRMEPHPGPPVWTWALAAAAVVLAGFASWTVLVQVPRLERELAAARGTAAAAPKQVEVPVVVWYLQELLV